MDPLSVPEAIEARRSVRHFRADPIDEDLLERLVGLARAAPSCWNLQPWRIVLVRGDAERSALHAAAFRQAQILEAPVTFVFAVDVDAWREDLPTIVETARAAGAWSDEYCAHVLRSVPIGQSALADAGRLRETAIKDAMIAATHVALAAQSLGLGSILMNGWDERRVKEVIGAEERPEIAIAVLLPVGHPRVVPGNPGRLPRGRTVSEDKIG